MSLDHLSPIARRIAAPLLVIAISVGAFALIAGLQHQSSASRDQQAKLAHMTVVLNQLQTAPFIAEFTPGGSKAQAAQAIRSAQQEIDRTLRTLENEQPVPALAAVRDHLQDNYLALGGLASMDPGQSMTPKFMTILTRLKVTADVLRSTLADATTEYRDRAAVAQRRALIGSGGALLILMLAFFAIYRRAIQSAALAHRYAAQNASLLETSRVEALHDSLTGLSNRRALTNDLEAAFADATVGEPALLALFDLDGFKQYNDTFGHPAGDALLTRLGERLANASEGRATAYRVGGDEFCLLIPAGTPSDGLVELAAAALSDRGDAFTIGCSYGVVALPTEAATPEDALRVVDVRMYEQKNGRSSAGRQATDVLVQVLTERHLDLDEHLCGVARLTASAAEELGLPEHEVRRFTLAAELHDVGKAAIPDTILAKPGPLSEEEWTYMREHPLIGERIVRVAPSLAHCAELVRSSHERFDGTGYPDGLAAFDIPLGARIIAVCDAYDAMVSERPYRAGRDHDDAVAELKSNAGTQFDPEAVDALCTALASLHRNGTGGHRHRLAA